MAVPSLCFSLLILIQTLIITSVVLVVNCNPTLNISHFIYPITTLDHRPQPSPFLQDVLRAIFLRQGWNDSEPVRVSKLDVENARFGSSPRYEFELGSGKTQLVFKLRDDVSVWEELAVKGGSEFDSAVKEVGAKAVIGTFRVKGPVELVAKGEDNEFLLQLPRNTSQGGLKRILVGNDITVEVSNAREISLSFASKLGRNKSQGNMKKTKFWPSQHSTCKSLLPVHISGSAKVKAFRDRNPCSYVQTKFHSRNTIELFPQKCYIGDIYEKQHFGIESLSLKISVMEKLLNSILGSKINQNGFPVFISTNIRASTVFRFKIEVERTISTEDRLSVMLSDWRTRPTVQRVWFEVVARIEENRLKPITTRKIRPFVKAVSYAWSDIMSNISFTKLPSFLVPPEDLTLDVR